MNMKNFVKFVTELLFIKTINKKGIVVILVAIRII